MSDSNSDKPTRYHEAGVNLDAAQEVVARYKNVVKETHIPGVLSGLGGFGALFGLREAGVPLGEGADPVLVAGTDGVGTKLKLAFELDRHESVGIDCVAMCVNDVLTTGARPLFFLDYLATGKLEPEQAEGVVRGIAQGCIQSQCALIGGETAEMPGFYARGEYDIAGFCVGVVDRADILGPTRVQLKDKVLGIASSGVHSNGFSLVRKIITDANLDLNQTYPELHPEHTLGDILLEPTRIYTRATQALHEHQISALAHITGGGFHENIPRIMPPGMAVDITVGSWPIPPIFEFLRVAGDIPDEELFHVFNMGIGMVVILRGDPQEALQALSSQGYDAWHLGEVVEAQDRAEINFK